MSEGSMFRQAKKLEKLLEDERRFASWHSFISCDHRMIGSVLKAYSLGA